MLTSQERAAVIRETFEAIASIGFAKFKADELLWHGNRVSEDDRQLYFREFEKEHFAGFEKMASGASDERLLDARQDWIDKANAMGLLGWQAEKGRDTDPVKRQTLKELFAEWRADYAARDAEEKLRREGPPPVRARFREWECELECHRYGNGRAALVLVGVGDREPVATVTVNLPDEPLARDEVFVKDWSENAGMLQAMEAAGIVAATGEHSRSVGAPKARIVHPELRQRVLEQQEPKQPEADQDRGR